MFSDYTISHHSQYIINDFTSTWGHVVHAFTKATLMLLSTYNIQMSKYSGSLQFTDYKVTVVIIIIHIGEKSYIQVMTMIIE